MAGVYDLAFHQIPDFPKQYFYILIHKMSCHGKRSGRCQGVAIRVVQKRKLVSQFGISLFL